MPYGDGTLSVASMKSTNWDGRSALSFNVLAKANAIIEPVLSANASDKTGFRIEQLNGAQRVWLRAVGLDNRGNEQASAWADAKPDALLTLGIVDAYGKRMLMLSGAEEKIELVISSAASWQVDVTTQE